MQTNQALAAIAAWDISMVKASAVKKGLYRPDEIDLVELEYKRYIALCIAHPNMSMPTPLKIDELWHQHILFTRDYTHMCQGVGGVYIHHSPFTNGEKGDPEAMANLRALYLREFGVEPSWSIGALCQKCGGGSCNRCQRTTLTAALCSPNPNCEGKSRADCESGNCSGPSSCKGDPSCRAERDKAPHIAMAGREIYNEGPDVCH